MGGKKLEQEDREMKIPLIVVKYKETGHEHIVGTDVHDNMYLSEKGGLQYRNLQNGAGTEFGEDGYEFAQLDKYECIDNLEVHFVSPGELLDKLISGLEREGKELYEMLEQEVLVKHTPMKLKRETTLVGDYRCPRCNAAFIDGCGKTNYCGNCGQRLDWDDENEES
jgi:hypothetical protein